MNEHAETEVPRRPPGIRMAFLDEKKLAKCMRYAIILIAKGEEPWRP